MATRATEVATYADLAARLDANGALAGIVEILSASNAVLTDMLVREANDGSGHKTTVRTGIPEAAWRMLNYGVPRVKTRTASVRDTTGMLEVYAEVDVRLAEISGNQKAFRMSEARGIMEGMSQQMASTVFYGNTLINPERFLGLAPRYSTLNAANAESAENVIDGGGTDVLGQTSIWLVTWGEDATHGLYPQHSRAGLSHRDLGEHTLLDEDGGQFQGYRDHFKWDLGLSVRDWRKNVRICNVQVSDLSDVTYMKSILKLMIDASERVPVGGEDPYAGGGRKVWYMGRAVRTAMRHAILDKIANNLTWENIEGRRVLQFDDIPIRRVDAILSNEAVVV